MAKGTIKKNAVGNIVAIPLTNGKFAYAKILEDLDFSIFDFVSDQIVTGADVSSHPISFFQTCTDIAVKKGVWPVVGSEQFLTEEDRYAPPKATFYLRETNEWTMFKTP